MDHETTMPAPLTQPSHLGQEEQAERGNIRSLLLFIVALLLLAALIYFL